MSYEVRFTERADKDLRKLDFSQRANIMAWVRKNLVDCEDPRRSGHALTGDLAGLWRYRVGGYRLVAEIHDGELVILVIEVAHRRNVYRSVRFSDQL